MTAATGPPAKMAANRDELTPMMAQYFELCAEYEDSLVLFQVGDFYETFCEAAEEASRVLEITLTQREDSSGTYPMAGIPIDSAASYIETLLDADYRVAIADQVQDPEEATGVVDRAVTRVVTPGTVVEDELLTAGTNNYVGALAGEYAAAFVDVSTGEFLATSGDSRATVADEIERLRPAELIVGPDVPEDAFEFEGMVTPFDEGAFDADAARETLEAYVNNPDSVLANEDEVRACGALLSYAEYTQGGEDRLEYVTRLRRYDPRDFVILDATALRSLEVFENRERGETGTLFETLRDTSCALGRRKLTHWLRRPLLDAGEIEGRLDAVEEWTGRSLSREDARAHLADVYDIERLIGRVSAGRANARDLRSLKGSLDVIPDVKAAMDDLESEKLTDLRESLDELADVRDLIDRAVAPDPPIEITEGGVIARGFDDELDRLRETEREGREWVADLEAQERERTGIDSLSVGFNQVHGYYIEVTNPNLDSVPDEYTRRQTLKNSERFYTPDLKRREDEILGAAERADTREYHVFREVRDEVAAEADRVQRVAEVLAELDVLATLAAVAVERDYVRPDVVEPVSQSASGDAGRGIEIRGGRHPVVETVQPSFVPNDADLVDERLAVITGPNMSGKSTYMRQIALIVVLAQIGSFVPADAARIPIVDRVFTRVGASDDIAGGQSTFMREMSELTEILHNATADSLVLLDEVGRGTSTTDGLAIARAVTEFVHDEIGATTLFATHYHELTGTADALDGACNLHFAAERADDDVTFLHAVRRGGASSSYGVEVARMAGVPDAVVERAYDLIEREGEEPTGAEGSGVGSDADGGIRDPTERDEPEVPVDPPTGERRSPVESRAEPGVEHDVLAEIRELNIAELTPLEALNRLNEIKRGIDDADH